MDIMTHMAAEGHEQLVMVADQGAGLKAIIAIHDTTLGPACGGTRIWPYESEEDAVRDALRLSQAMTYKAAAADLPLGGGKAVIIADSHTGKTEALLRAYGRFVDSLGGRYLTTTDVGSTGRDLEYVKQETDYVMGLPTSAGGSGDTSVMTGLGIYMGMKACAREAWDSDSLNGKTVAMQGFGKVAFHLAHHLLKENARLVVTDVYPGALDRAREMGLEVVAPEAIYDVDCDVFSPCALGGVLNVNTIPRLKCRVIAGRGQQPTDDRGRRRGIEPPRRPLRPGLHRQQRRHHQRGGGVWAALQRRTGPGENGTGLRNHPTGHRHCQGGRDTYLPGRRPLGRRPPVLGKKHQAHVPFPVEPLPVEEKILPAANIPPAKGFTTETAESPEYDQKTPGSP